MWQHKNNFISSTRSTLRAISGWVRQLLESFSGRNLPETRNLIIYTAKNRFTVINLIIYLFIYLMWTLKDRLTNNESGSFPELVSKFSCTIHYTCGARCFVFQYHIPLSFFLQKNTAHKNKKKFKKKSPNN